MPKLSDYSKLQRTATTLAIMAYPLLCVATRVWGSTSTAVRILPFVYPVAVALLAWSLARTETTAGEHNGATIPLRKSGLGLGTPPPSPLGGRQHIATQVAMLMAMWFFPVFPRHSGFSDVLVLTCWFWWMGTCVLIAFGIPRLLRKRAPEDGSSST